MADRVLGVVGERVSYLPGAFVPPGERVVGVVGERVSYLPSGQRVSAGGAALRPGAPFRPSPISPAEAAAQIERALEQRQAEAEKKKVAEEVSRVDDASAGLEAERAKLEGELARIKAQESNVERLTGSMVAPPAYVRAEVERFNQRAETFNAKVGDFNARVGSVSQRAEVARMRAVDVALEGPNPVSVSEVVPVERFSVEAGRELVKGRVEESFRVGELRAALETRDRPVIARELVSTLLSMPSAPAQAFAGTFAGLSGFGFGKIAEAGIGEAERVKGVPFRLEIPVGPKGNPVTVLGKKEAVDIAVFAGEFAGLSTLYVAPEFEARFPQLEVPRLDLMAKESFKNLASGAGRLKLAVFKPVPEEVFRYPKISSVKQGMVYTVEPPPERQVFEFEEAERLREVGRAELNLLKEEAQRRAIVLRQRKTFNVLADLPKVPKELEIRNLQEEAVRRANILRQRKTVTEAFRVPSVPKELEVRVLQEEAGRRVAELKVRKDFAKLFGPLPEDLKTEAALLRAREAKISSNLPKTFIEKVPSVKGLPKYTGFEIVPVKGGQAQIQLIEKEVFPSIKIRPSVKVVPPETVFPGSVSLKLKPVDVQKFDIPGSIAQLSRNLPRLKPPVEKLFEAEMADLFKFPKGVRPIVKTGDPRIDEFVRKNIGALERKPLFDVGGSLKFFDSAGGLRYDISGQGAFDKYVQELKFGVQRGIFAVPERSPIEKELAKSVPKQGIRFGEFLGAGISPRLAAAMGIKPGVTPKNLQRAFERERAREEQRVNSFLREGLGVTPVFGEASLSKVAEVSGIKTAQRFGTSVREAFKEAEKVVEEELPRFKPVFRLPLFPLMVSARKRKTVSKGAPGFDTFLKVRGMFRKQNPRPLHRSTALALGSFLADRSSAATFKVERAREPATGKRRRASLRKFRKPVRKGRPVASSPLFIERNRFRIDMPGEKQEITMRGLAALRNRFFGRRKKKRRRRR